MSAETDNVNHVKSAGNSESISSLNEDFDNVAEKMDTMSKCNTDTNSNSKSVCSETGDDSKPCSTGTDEPDGDMKKHVQESENDLRTKNENSVAEKNETSVIKECESEDKVMRNSVDVSGKDTQTEEEKEEADDEEEEEEEEGIEIKDSDIVKPTDVFGKGKRQHMKKVDGDYTEDFDSRDSTPLRHGS